MAFRSSTSITPGNGTSAAPAVPAGAAIGDIAIVGIYKESTSAVTPPSGFTQKASLTTSATARGSLVVFWKRLTAADTGTYSFTWSGSTWRGAACALFSGRIASGDPFDGTVGTAESTTGVTTLDVSTSPAAANGDAVGMWTNFNGGASFTPPTNYTERVDTNVITLDTRDAVASGSTGNVSAAATITDFMKAFLGVLAVAGGGTDATPAPAVTVTTVAAPQATPSAAASETPAVTVATVAAPQAIPAVSGSGTPGAIGTVVTAPQATAAVADTATPAVTPVVVGLPQATPTTAGNATATPATIAAVVTLPQVSPSGAGAASPPVTVSTTSLPQAARQAGATVSPATVVTVVALPQATPQAGGNVTAAPSRIVTVATVPQAVPMGAATASPARIVTFMAAPAAIPTVHDTATPGVLTTVASLPQSSVLNGAGAVPAAITALITVLSSRESINAGPARIASVVTFPLSAAIDEGAQVKGTSDPEVNGAASFASVIALTRSSAVTHRNSSMPTVSDG